MRPSKEEKEKEKNDGPHGLDHLTLHMKDTIG